MLNSFEPAELRLPFGWRWIGRSLLLRRWQSLSVLLITGAVYAVSLVFPISAQRAVDDIVAGRVGLELAVLAVLALVSIALEAALHFRQQRLIIELGTFLDRRISRRAFTHLLRSRIDGASFSSGEAMNHFKQAERIRDFVLHEVPRGIFDFGGALVALAMCFYYDIAVGLTVLLFCPVLVFATNKKIRSFQATAETYYTSIGVRQNALTETVNGIATVKALALEGARMRRWETTTKDMLTKLRAVRQQYLGFNLRAQILARSMTVLVLSVGCWRLFQGDLTVGSLLALQLLSGRITFPLMMFGDFYRGYKEADIASPANSALPWPVRERAAVHPPVRRFGSGGIRLSKVSLTYPGAASPALKDITLALPERGMIAIVGRNGSGKSTLIRILLGLQRNYVGHVEIGGRDLKDYDPRWLRSRIGVVDQDTVLFAGSVRENLISGRQLDEADLRESLRFAGALEFVEGPTGRPRYRSLLKMAARCRAGNGSVYQLPARWCVIRTSCCWMSPQPFLMRRLPWRLRSGSPPLDATASCSLSRIIWPPPGMRIVSWCCKEVASSVKAHMTGSFRRFRNMPPLWSDYVRSLGETSPAF